MVYEKGKKDVSADLRMQHLSALKEAVIKLFKIEDSNIIVKERQLQDNKSIQYGKLANAQCQRESDNVLVVKEGPAKFYINPYDYLDCGLFLDHRPLRRKIFNECTPQSRVLNLFSYSGAFSVVSALKGASTVSVDWSNTYQRWAQDNFRLNQLDLSKHQFVISDIVDYLRSNAPTINLFDIIIIDPPTFSNSKKRVTAFGDNWDVERDHFQLIQMATRYLTSDGKLYFSTNKRSFKISSLFFEAVGAHLTVKNISKETIPKDIRDSKIHQTFLVTIAK